MLIHKFIVRLVGIYVLLQLFGNCGGGKVRLIEFVPSNSNMVVIVKWSAVRKDDGLKQVINSEIYETQIRRFGIDEVKVGELIVFGTIGAESPGGLLLRGSFDSRRTLAALKSQGWNEESIDGQKVYVNGKEYAASPTDGVLAAGTREDIAAIFRASKNPRESLTTSASFKKIKTALPDGESPAVSGFLLAPDGTIEAVDAALSVADSALSLFDLGGVGAILKNLNLASGVGFTIARGTNQKYAINLSALMRDEKTAKIAVGSFNILKGLSEMTPTDPKDRETGEALRDFSVTREENILLLKMQMAENALLSPNGS